MRSVMQACFIKARDTRQRTLRAEEGAGALWNPSWPPG